MNVFDGAVCGREYVRSFDETQWVPGSEKGLFGWMYQRRMFVLVDAIHQQVKGRRVIDIGCAQGNLALLLSRNGYDVTAVEVNSSFLEYARSKDPRHQVNWINADVRDLEALGQYDAAVLAEVIGHTGDPEGLIRTVSALLRPGLLLLTTPNGQRIRQSLPSFNRWALNHPDRRNLRLGPSGEHHVFLFTRAEICGLLMNNFSDVRFRPITTAIVNRATARALRSRSGTVVLRRLDKLVASLGALSGLLVNDWLVLAEIRSVK